jgi:tetratricopeptide (TPR) repeat protein
MERRKLLWGSSLALGMLIGCTRREVVQPDPYNPVPATASPDRASRRTKAPIVRRNEPDTLVTQTEGKPETLVKIAEVQSQLAVDENRPAEQRQKALTLAKHNYQRAIQIDNRHAPAYLGLGRLCSLVGEHQQALKILDEGLAKIPNDALLWFERGMVLGRLQRFDEAIASLIRASQIDPNNSQLAKSVGLMMARAGRADEGASWLGRVMSEADARFNVGRIMQHIGQTEEARRQLELALRANPNHEGALAALDTGPANDRSMPPTATSPTTRSTTTPPWDGQTGHPSMLRISVDSPQRSSPPPTRQEPSTPSNRGGVRIGFDPGN